MSELIPVRVTRVSSETADIRLIELSPLGDDALPPWDPGAHIDVHLPGLVRQYSLIGPQGGAAYRIGVLRDAQSRGGSRYLHEEVRTGDELRIGRPRNLFPLTNGTAPAILIGGGIGITPLLAMAERLRQEEGNWHLHYCVRSRDRLAFVDAMAAFGDRVTIHVDEEAGGPPDLARLIKEAPSGTHFYCCGPAVMLSAFAAAAAGLPQQRVHIERFAAVVPEGDSCTEEFELVLSRSGRTLRVPEHQSILETLEANGIEAPWSCRLGVCGECRTTVLEGACDHRDSVLSEAERSSQDVILICCSRARTPRLVLEL
jgi:ferredoxin-NADP reductase